VVRKTSFPLAEGTVADREESRAVELDDGHMQSMPRSQSNTLW
jgi:hypothetical protein